MLQQGRGLVSRLAEALGIERPPPAISGTALKALSAAQFVHDEAEELFEAVQEPVALLFAAAMEAGILPPNPRNTAPARYPLYRAPLVALLREDRGAAMVVSSLIQQYLDAEQEYYVLAEALETGDMENLNTYKARGKFFYLARMRFAVEKYPLLVQLFGDAQGAARAPQPDQAPAAPPRGTGPAAPPRGTQGLEGPRRGAGGPDVSSVMQGTVMGIRKTVSGVLQAPPTPGGGPTPEQHKVLLDQGAQLMKSLQGKMLILQAASDKAQGKPPSTESFLPMPALQTADTLAVALGSDKFALKLVQTTLQKYRDAGFFLRRRNPEDHMRLRALLTELGALGLQLGEHTILSKLFPAA